MLINMLSYYIHANPDFAFEGLLLRLIFSFKFIARIRYITNRHAKNYCLKFQLSRFDDHSLAVILIIETLR